MKKKIIGVNLVILLIYSIALFPKGEYLDMIPHGLAAIAHSVLLLLIAIVLFIMRKPEKGKAFLLALLLVVVVGGSVCSTTL